jgi:NDP-sugar pyrophosphorylase family protein
VANLRVPRFIGRWKESPFGHLDELAWHITSNVEDLVRRAFSSLGPDYRQDGEIRLHLSAIVEPGVVQGPVIIGPRCLVAAGAYLHGGIYLDEDCIVGPNFELKTSFMLKGAKLAHLNFVGDSISALA